MAAGQGRSAMVSLLIAAGQWGNFTLAVASCMGVITPGFFILSRYFTETVFLLTRVYCMYVLTFVNNACTGANVRVENLEGETPMKLAECTTNNEVLRLLTQAEETGGRSPPRNTDGKYVTCSPLLCTVYTLVLPLFVALCMNIAEDDKIDAKSVSWAHEIDLYLFTL